jgi:IS4 transposase
VLITTLLSPKDASKAELKSLYKSRWQIEVDFRNIKTTMGMETLSCKTPEMSEKEIWIYFLAYNLIRLLMAQSALLADIVPRQLSFNIPYNCGWPGVNKAHTSIMKQIRTYSLF